MSVAVNAALTRREFLTAAGAVGAAAMLPLSSLAAVEHASGALPLEDWTIDDMWGVYPRYAEPIGYGRRCEEPLLAANAVDAPFLAA